MWLLWPKCLLLAIYKPAILHASIKTHYEGPAARYPHIIMSKYNRCKDGDPNPSRHKTLYFVYCGENSGNAKNPCPRFENWLFLGNIPLWPSWIKLFPVPEIPRRFCKGCPLPHFIPASQGREGYSPGNGDTTVNTSSDVIFSQNWNFDPKFFLEQSPQEKFDYRCVRVHFCPKNSPKNLKTQR